jgi:hypothetical protein
VVLYVNAIKGEYVELAAFFWYDRWKELCVDRSAKAAYILMSVARPRYAIPRQRRPHCSSMMHAYRYEPGRTFYVEARQALVKLDQGLGETGVRVGGKQSSTDKDELQHDGCSVCVRCVRGV